MMDHIQMLNFLTLCYYFYKKVSEVRADKNKTGSLLMLASFTILLKAREGWGFALSSGD